MDKSRILVENQDYRLCLEHGCDFNYIVWTKANGFLQEKARAWNMCSKVTKMFTSAEISKAKATLHAIKYVDSKYVSRHS